jgi:hypothetical protein
MVRLRSVLVSVCVFALLSIAASAAPPPAHSKTPRKLAVPHLTGKVADPSHPPGGPPVIIMDPESWVLIDAPTGGISAEETSPPPSTGHIYILHGDAGINESPLPQTVKDDLVPAPQDPGTISIEDEGTDDTYIVSQEIAEGIEASELAGALTPEIDAIAEPLDEETSYSSSGTNKSIFGGSCATHDKNYEKVINLHDYNYDKTFQLSDGFTGSFSANAQLEGSITAQLNFGLKRKKVFGKCVPYGVKFQNVHAFGNATSTAGITLTGGLAYQNTFGPWDISKAHLFSYTYWAGPIPITIGFNLPITAGLDLGASVTGTINYNGNFVASGTFDYVCTLDDCSGSANFENTSPTGSTQSITGSVTGHIKPVPHVDVALRAYLYDDALLYAQIGVRPHLLGDLWGYTGNTCGDADGNGNNESVHALTFDLDRRIDITAEAKIIGRDPWQRTVRTGPVVHMGFWDLNTSDAMQPLLQGPANLNVGAAGNYNVKIRPCWPYTDKVTYQLNWGDGSAAQSLEGVPGTDVPASHTWTAAGSPTVTATSVQDLHGRTLNQSTSRTVQVTVPVPLTITSTPSPASSTYGNAITWTVTPTGGDPATRQYALVRQLAGTSTWLPATLAWQASNVLSWTPAAGDVGTWTFFILVKDGNTPANPGYASSTNPGQTLVVAPLAVTATASPASATYGNTLSWTATATGGTPGTIQYALARQLVGTSTWTPIPLVWQAGNVLNWTPTSADVGTWQMAIAVRDVNTAPDANGYGYSAFTLPGTVQVSAPITALSITPSPASSVYGNAITWTATASGGVPASTKYALFRRRAGATAWIPDVTTPAWQTSNVLSWTPTSADTGTTPWEIIVWVKDGNTPANANTYGYSAYANAGPVQVVTAPLTLSVTPSPASSVYGNTISWTATAGGGTPATTKFAFFRRRAGTTPWTPDVTAPAWQSSNVMSWTPSSADVGTWEIFIWVKDGDTAANANGYGYAAYVNAGNVQVVTPPLTLTVTGSPASATYGNAITWTATATGGTPATTQYAFFRRLAGATAWTPAVTAPAWQTSNTYSWTPTSADVGTWETYVWVKDGNTAANANTYGYAAGYNSGTVQIVAPLTLTVTGSPASSVYGNAITWTATAGGGVPATTRYAFFRRRSGTTPWTPDVNAPAWQTSNTYTWTPTSSDTGTWDTYVWVKDGNTPAGMNTYGYAAGFNSGAVRVVAPLSGISCTSPSPANYGTAFNWTVSATGGDSATLNYALFRRLAGTTSWTPATPSWQTGNVLSWTPVSTDVGSWEIVIWAKDGNTPASPGYSASCNPGTVQVLAPLSVAGTSSPASANYGTTLTWTATATGGTPSTTRYAFFRRPAGATAWIPDVTAPAWQTSNVMTWTPTSANVGSWDIIIWVKDGNTPANANGYGYAAYYNAGQVQVTAPPLGLTVTGSPATSPYGNTITWTATASGGVPATTRFAFFRRRSGAATWIPDVSAPAWQTSNVMTWTPDSADAGAWDIIIWVKDGNTAANANGYGYAAYANAGGVQVTVAQAYPAKGWVDGYNSQHIWGWACDPDYPTQSNRVDLYNTNGQSLGSAGAFGGSSSAINSACGGGTAHYFDYYPSGGIPSGTHFNVWSIDLPYATAGNDNRKLGGTGAIGDGTEFVIP